MASLVEEALERAQSQRGGSIAEERIPGINRYTFAKETAATLTSGYSVEWSPMLKAITSNNPADASSATANNASVGFIFIEGTPVQSLHGENEVTILGGARAIASRASAMELTLHYPDGKSSTFLNDTAHLPLPSMSPTGTSVKFELPGFYSVQIDSDATFKPAPKAA